jgi:hypothetical protein
MDLFGNDRKDRFGLDRYSTEHWVGSHPDLTPCDLGNEHIMRYLTPNRHPDYKWNLGPTEMHRYAPDGIRDYAFEERVQHDVLLRLREYFLLPGNLLKCKPITCAF